MILISLSDCDRLASGKDCIKILNYSPVSYSCSSFIFTVYKCSFCDAAFYFLGDLCFIDSIFKNIIQDLIQPSSMLEAQKTSSGGM